MTYGDTEHPHAECREKIAELEREVERLRAFVAGQPCECYDEYGKRLPSPCERCRLLYEHETWEEFEAEAKE